jgi:hypothetical protein
MGECPICQHAKVQAINRDLRSNLGLGQVACKYHIAKQAILGHVSHMGTTEPQENPLTTTQKCRAEAILQVGRQMNRPHAQGKSFVPDCPICEHPKRRALEGDLTGGLLPSVASLRYEVSGADLWAHLAHDPALAQAKRRKSLTYDGQVMAVETCEDEASRVSDDPLRRVKHHVHEAAQAWREVEETRRTQERLQMILQEAFADPDMGL